MGGARYSITTILGSLRPDNMTGKALALVQDELRRLGREVVAVDPADLKLSPPGGPVDADSVKRLQEAVSGATGVVISTPEYHGSYSSTVKLIIDNLGFPSALSGKPVALLGVAAGTIGAIKALEHLRSVCSHVGAVVLPAPVSVAGVHRLFDQQGRCLDAKVESRIRGLARSLIDYIERHICPRLTLEAMVRGEERP
jgi:FMN reductase